MLHREALDVGLVDHAVGQRRVRRAVVLPVEARVDDDALRDRRRVVGVVRRQVVVLAARRDVRVDVALVEQDRPVDRLRVRVQQQLGGVEAMAALRVVGPVDAVAVALAGVHAGQVAVPVERGALGQLDRTSRRPRRRTGTARRARRARRRSRSSCPRRPTWRRGGTGLRARPPSAHQRSGERGQDDEAGLDRRLVRGEQDLLGALARHVDGRCGRSWRAACTRRGGRRASRRARRSRPSSTSPAAAARGGRAAARRAVRACRPARPRGSAWSARRWRCPADRAPPRR